MITFIFYFLCNTDDAQTRLLKLQLENQRLETELESFKLDSMNQCSEKVLELEKENKRLSTKVSQFAFHRSLLLCSRKQILNYTVILIQEGRIL